VALRDTPRDVEGAGRCIGEALAFADARGMRPLAAHRRLARAEVARLLGDVERSRSDVAAALADYRAIDMPLPARRAEALLQSLCPTRTAPARARHRLH